ncbi:MAG: zinc-binding dehydrogenase, partial [Paracoccaceae bacterium]|nr:zinc-binding dehydrogenase [Paracoccaceae bacterium]
GRIVERAVIMGTGPMGVLMGLALKARGTEDVIMVDLDEDRLAMASDMGLTARPAGGETEAAFFQSCDLAVDATGVPAVAEGLTRYLANGGSALFFGVCPQDARISISPFEVFRRQLSLFGTHSLNHNIPQALEVLSRMDKAAIGVVTHHLEPDAIANVISGRERLRAMKVQMSLQI